MYLYVFINTDNINCFYTPQIFSMSYALKLSSVGYNLLLERLRKYLAYVCVIGG